MPDSKSPDALTTPDDVVLPVERESGSRRSFLKMAGFGVASASLAACSRGPVRLVVPRGIGEPDITPGRGYRIATTCGGCDAGCGVLASCRDGRPVKLEGDRTHRMSRGGLCAVGQASVLDLYDGQRLDGARLGGEPASWADLDAAVTQAIANSGSRTRVLTRTITSPSTRAWIEQLVSKTQGAHVEFDALSCSALLDAHAAAFGRRVFPRLRFGRASVIASFAADFLGTWVSPVEFAKGYRDGRRPDSDLPRMSRHVQIESRLSLTGCAADTRHVVAPWEQRAALTSLRDALARLAAGSEAVVAAAAPLDAKMQALATELWAARGESLVVCGINDRAAQALTVLINRALGNYGRTLDLAAPSYQRRGDDGALAKLIDDMNAGNVGLLIVHGLDPAHDLPDSAGFVAAAGNVDLVVATASRMDATATLAGAIAPAAHELESWNDCEAVGGLCSISQPTIPPVRSARTLRASIARWLGDERDDRELFGDHWRRSVFPRVPGRSASQSADALLDRVLHDGHVAVISTEPATAPRFDERALQALLDGVPEDEAPATGALSLVLYPGMGVPESRHAHNPWLQEMPDPVTTAVWDNFALLAPETAHDLGLEPGDVVRVAEADGSNGVELPVLTQPGQHPGTVAVALAYGVLGTDRFARIGPSWLEGRLTTREGDPVGSRAAHMARLTPNGFATSGVAVAVRATGARSDVATTQSHHRLEVPKHLAPQRGAVRDPILETTFSEWTGNREHAIPRHHAPAADLWPDDHVSDGPHWGLAIDLSACIGCAGCVVACQAENNVPVVGKDEVRRHREMTWLRIDRYYTRYGDKLRVLHQPMMCQHCENAPCETVCPVLATAHSEDGLNQQVYNRCVGTRYCANNCPYKVRRFNWFDYPRGKELRNLALNPDVTVRSRGVMEKCSMCIQRIQGGKAESRRTGLPVEDGDIQTACQESCPSDAITFGDLNDDTSAVARLSHSDRAYAVLGELNVKPGVSYLANVRNADDEAEARHE